MLIREIEELLNNFVMNYGFRPSGLILGATEYLQLRSEAEYISNKKYTGTEYPHIVECGGLPIIISTQKGISFKIDPKDASRFYKEN